MWSAPLPRCVGTWSAALFTFYFPSLRFGSPKVIKCAEKVFCKNFLGDLITSLFILVQIFMLKLALVCSIWHCDSKAMGSCSLRRDTAVEILSVLSAQNSIYTSLCTFEVVSLQIHCVVLSCSTTKWLILAMTYELIPPKTRRKLQRQDLL